MIHFKKSQPSPECLKNQHEKAKGDWKCGDVIPRLNDDFYGKCYLCEHKGSTTLNIEHFRPHRGNKNLMYDWNNLFLACGHCNNIKGDKYENILNCTDHQANVENRIKMFIVPMPKERPQISPMDDSPEVKETCELLEIIFNGNTEMKKLESTHLRELVLSEVEEFRKNLIEYLREGMDPDTKINYLLPRIKIQLSRCSSFTSFKRSLVLNNEELRSEFEQYFD